MAAAFRVQLLKLAAVRFSERIEMLEDAGIVPLAPADAEDAGAPPVAASVTALYGYDPVAADEIALVQVYICARVRALYVYRYYVRACVLTAG